MGAIPAGAKEAPTLAGPPQPEKRGRAVFLVRRLSGMAQERIVQGGIDRLPDAPAFLITLHPVSMCPLLRYLRQDPFPAEVFRFGLISSWIGFLRKAFSRQGSAGSVGD